MDRDAEHLRLLSIFHYIFAGITGLCGSIPLIYIALGLWMVSAPANFGNSRGALPQTFDPAVGWLFVLVGGAIVLYSWGMAAALIYAGRCLVRREKHTFCLVVAAFSCLNTPHGTVLGVFTIIVLVRPSVKEMFEANRRTAPSG